MILLSSKDRAVIKKHPHRLKRTKFRNGEKVYFCTLPDCDFKCSIQLSLGKTALCWRCSKPFQMTEQSCRLMKPHCSDCTKSKNEEITEITSDDLNLNLDNHRAERDVSAEAFVERLRKSLENAKRNSSITATSTKDLFEEKDDLL